MEWLWVLLPVAASCGWIAGYRSKKRKVAESKNAANYYKGLNYLLNHQPDRALDVFLKLVENDSESVETHFALASLFRQRGDVAKATKIHQNLIARPSLDNYQRGLSLLELGRDYLSAGLNDRAESLLLELKSDKNHADEAMNSLLEIYQREQDWEKAIEVTKGFSNKNKEYINHMIAHFNCEIGEKLMRKGNFNQALTYAETAEATEKKGVRAKILLANIALKQDDYKTAFSQYMRILDIDPNQLSQVLTGLRACMENLPNNKKLLASIKQSIAKLKKMPSAKGYAVFLADYESIEDGDQYLQNQFKEGRVTTTLLKEWIDFKTSHLSIDSEDIDKIKTDLARLEAARSDHNCQRCGYKSQNHYWQCPSCKSWDTIRFEMT